MRKDLAEKIVEIVKGYQVKSGYLDLEITESAFIDNGELALDQIQILREIGFSVSMDDFGAGISSLHRLKDVPVDILKIDKAFLDGALDNSRGITIIKNIINMAKDLQLQTVAEGIETKQQQDLLVKLGCDVGQGYYFSRPLTEKDFLNKIKNHLTVGNFKKETE